MLPPSTFVSATLHEFLVSFVFSALFVTSSKNGFLGLSWELNPTWQGCITALGGSVAIAKTCRRCIPICRNKEVGLLEGMCPVEKVLDG